MLTINDIVQKYTAGEIELAEANKKLAELGVGFHLNPEKNVMTEDEKRQTVVGYYPEQANGYGLLDTGTGSLDKAKVTNGKFDYAINAVIDGKPNMIAWFMIAGKTYAVVGDKLTEK